MQNKVSRSFTVTLWLTSIILLSGCVSSTKPLANIPRIAPLALAQTDENAAKNDALQSLLRVDDTISIAVAREPTLSLGSVRIGQDGTIDVPYIGQLTAAGRTPRALAEEIEADLRKNYLSDPRVSINVVEYASHMVVVEGAVGSPGQVAYRNGSTLLTVIAKSGGPTRIAKLNQIAIFRTTRGERQVAVFDLAKVRSGAQPDPLLEPGDQVIVGFSGMRQAWQDLLQAAPLFAIFYRL